MRVLIYHGKDEVKVWDASSPANKAAAVFGLFRYLDSLGCYQDTDERYLKAAAGDVVAAAEMLVAHQMWEYECFEVKDIERVDRGFWQGDALMMSRIGRHFA